MNKLSVVLGIAICIFMVGCSQKPEITSKSNLPVCPSSGDFTSDCRVETYQEKLTRMRKEEADTKKENSHAN